jgi:anaerobic selenocysteine-containing dehydrogenase
VADLKAAHGRVLVHVGAAQPAELHALAHAMNEALGARGATYDLIEPAFPQAALQADAMKALIADMHAGQVSHLLIIDSNPLYTSPSSWGFAEALERVPFSVALARHADETARSTTWFVPQTHDWETWSDARAYDGTVTVLQPQALPLYGGLSAHAMLGLYLTAPPRVDGTERAPDLGCSLKGDSANGWSDALARGFVPGTASAPSDARLRTEGTAPSTTSTTASGDGLTLLLRVDPNLWDGRFANNPWLQELPRPLTKVVWDNPLLIAPALAARMQLTNGDCVRLAIDQASVVAPVWIMPGQAPDCITALLGSGRRAAGTVGDGVGIDFYPLAGLKGPVVLHKRRTGWNSRAPFITTC